MAASFSSAILLPGWFLLAAVVGCPCAAAQEPPLPPERQSAHTSDAACRARLESLGVVMDTRVKIPAPSQPACTIAEPVALQSVRGLPGNGPIRFSGTPVLACAMAERLAQFLVDVADPAARQLLNAGIASVDLGPGYTCRPRNNQPGAKLSSHSQGLAVDIASVTLDNG